MSTTSQLSENSHRGFDGLKAALCLASMEAKSNTASEMPVCLWRNGIGSRSSGKERDQETGLDYFLARYYSGAQGRFISADPLMASAIIEEPQSWNRYSYVSNNPLRFVDDDGQIKRDADGKPVFVRNEYASPVPIPHASGPSAVMQPGFLFADNGDSIVALKNESGDPRFDTNCHGTTFADGLFWINPDQVQPILNGDGYNELKKPTDIHQIGDVVIYRSGDPVHSTTVVKTENGKATEVRGEGGLQTGGVVTSPEGAWQKPARIEYWHKPEKKKKEKKEQKIQPKPPKEEED